MVEVEWMGGGTRPKLKGRRLHARPTSASSSKATSTLYTSHIYTTVTLTEQVVMWDAHACWFSVFTKHKNSRNWKYKF